MRKEEYCCMCCGLWVQNLDMSVHYLAEDLTLVCIFEARLQYHFICTFSTIATKVNLNRHPEIHLHLQ